MNQLSISKLIAYNRAPIPSLDEITKLEQFNSMIRFSVENKEKVCINQWLSIPNTLVLQHLNKKKYEPLEMQNSINGLMFWYSPRGTVTKMILIPESNYELLLQIGEPTKEFINYFENKVPVRLENFNDTSYKIKGIPPRFRHPGNHMKYLAQDQIYVRLEKVVGKK